MFGKSAFIVMFFSVLVSACSSLDPLKDPIGAGMFSGSMDATLALMRGVGNASKSPEGKTVFSFVISEAATTYFDKDDLKGKEDFRLYQLGSWVSRAQVCPNGYEIKKLKDSLADLHTYEGVCK